MQNIVTIEEAKRLRQGILNNALSRSQKQKLVQQKSQQLIQQN